MFCKKCGYELREDGRFCENCGAMVPEKNEIHSSGIGHEFFYKFYKSSKIKEKIRDIHKAFIVAYIMEFTAILIAGIFPTSYEYYGLGGYNRMELCLSVKFLILALILLIAGILAKKK